jgi:hypothetical protein
MGYNPVYSAESQPTFRRNIPSSSSGSNKPSRLVTCFNVSNLVSLFDPEYGGDVRPKRRFTFKGIYGFNSQEVVTLSILQLFVIDKIHQEFESEREK